MYHESLFDIRLDLRYFEQHRWHGTIRDPGFKRSEWELDVMKDVEKFGNKRVAELRRQRAAAAAELLKERTLKEKRE